MLSRDYNEIGRLCEKAHKKTGKGLLVQRYIDDPLLLNGFKFDFR